MPKRISETTANSLVRCIIGYANSQRGKAWLRQNPLFETNDFVNDLYLVLSCDKKFIETFERSTNNENQQRWTNHACNFAKYRIARRSCNRPYLSLEDYQDQGSSSGSHFRMRTEGDSKTNDAEAVENELDREQLVDTLSDDQREVIKLRLMGCNQSQIAISLGISRKTVRRRLNAAAKLLGFVR
jgi:RNA polymerase sigma factor (sigma-70 family)